jgi:hypothetical protein
VLTFPFVADPPLYFSVFVNGPLADLWKAMNGGLQMDDRIVVVRHGESLRSDSDRWKSNLSAHPLLVHPTLEPDMLDDGDGGMVIASGDKLGGRPHCVQDPELEGSDALLDQGYVQAVQLDFANQGDALVTGNWPFADGLFNLFAKPDPTSPTYWAVQS